MKTWFITYLDLEAQDIQHCIVEAIDYDNAKHKFTDEYGTAEYEIISCYEEFDDEESI